MKAHAVVLFSLICQSLCAQLSEWVYEGASELKVKLTDGSLFYWKKQFLDSQKLSQVYLSTTPTADYDRQIQVDCWYGSRQTWFGTNRTLISLKSGTWTTNCQEWWSSGRWDTGGNAQYWTGRDIDAHPYELKAWANMAILWQTNSDTFWSRCLEHNDQQYVLGLFRTNGLTTLTALSECNVAAGQTNFLRAPEGQGKYSWKFMTTSGCSHCGQGCAQLLPWQMVGTPRPVRAMMMELASNDSGLMQRNLRLSFPARGREDRWQLERSADGRQWAVCQSGIASLSDQVEDREMAVFEPLPESGFCLYRLSFRQATVNESIEQMMR